MPTSTLYIPSVDIHPFLADPTSEAAQKVIDSARAACVSTGFFQITGHGIPKHLQNEVFAASKRFFALPMSEKEPLSAKKYGSFKGYDVLASQSYEQDVAADLKEGFMIGADLAADNPHVLAKRFFAKPNIYPREDLLKSAEFKEPVERYYKALETLSYKILDLVAATLPYGPGAMDVLKGEPVCPLRLLHYPPTPKQTEGGKRQLGASAHTDFGAVTLLLQDDCEGLEVLDPATQKWELVPPKSDAYVVNLGDMMHKLTRGAYKSSVHRVINQAPTDRYSVVFFFNGTSDNELKPFGPKQEGDPEKDLTTEQFLFSRIKASYEKHAPKPATAD